MTNYFRNNKRGLQKLMEFDFGVHFLKTLHGCCLQKYS